MKIVPQGATIYTQLKIKYLLDDLIAKGSLMERNGEYLHNFLLFIRHTCCSHKLFLIKLYGEISIFTVKKAPGST